MKRRDIIIDFFCFVNVHVNDENLKENCGELKSQLKKHIDYSYEILTLIDLFIPYQSFSTFFQNVRYVFSVCHVYFFVLLVSPLMEMEFSKSKYFNMKYLLDI